MNGVLFGVCPLFLAGRYLTILLRPLPRIWRGDDGARPHPHRREVVPATGQTYLTFLLVVVPFHLGLAIAGLTALAHPDYGLPQLVGRPVAGLFCCSVIGLVVHLVLGATGRPRWLMPPPYRGRPTVRQDRIARCRAGIPPTDHPVRILEKYILLDTGGSSMNNYRRIQDVPEDAFLLDLDARCQEDGCAWHAMLDTTMTMDEQDAALRRLAAAHTTEVIAERWKVVF